MLYLIKPVLADQTRSIDSQFDLSASQFNLSTPTFGAFISEYMIPLAFSIAAIMVMFYFIIGAFELITSQGDKGHIVSARSKIYHSIIGFVILIAIFLIMQYLPTALGLNGFILF